MFSFGIWLRHMKTKNRNNLFENSYYQRSTILVGTHKSLFSPSFWQVVLFVGSLRSSRFLSFSRRKSNKRANKWACEGARLRWAKNWGEVGRGWARRERVTRGRVRTTTTTSTASTTSRNRDDPAYRFTRHAALDYCELFDIGHPCYGQLTPVISRYALTCITWAYRGLILLSLLIASSLRSRLF